MLKKKKKRNMEKALCSRISEIHRRGTIRYKRIRVSVGRYGGSKTFILSSEQKGGGLIVAELWKPVHDILLGGP